MKRSRIIGTGSYLPATVRTNHDLAAHLDTSHDWIVERTGIHQRHIAAEDEFCSDLAAHAARRAMLAAGVGPEAIDLIIVATTTPDQVFPASACLLQAKLGITQGAAFDLQAVCSGFIYALATADAYIRSGLASTALVIGSEVFSRILDWNDRRSCVLFGDGAGAVVLQACSEPGILSAHLHSDGRLSDILCVPGQLQNGQVRGLPYVQMDGPAVFKSAVKALQAVTHEALSANHLQASDLDWLVPHQANIRIMDYTAEKLGLRRDQVVKTVDRHANTSAASIPLALDTAVRDGRIQAGHTVLLESVGGGLTWGAVLLRWQA